jgi:transglutaminase-like putative cysteine protease
MTKEKFFQSAFIKSLKQNFLPMLLSAVSAAALEFVFVKELTNKYFLIAAAVGAALGLLRICSCKSTALKKLFTAAFTVAVPVYAVMILVKSNLVYPFIVWFFSGGQMRETETVFLIALAFFGGAFFGFGFYYFTQVIYRKLIVFVLGIIPYVVFVKSVVGIPYYFVIITMGLQIFIYVQQTRMKIGKEAKIGGKKSLITVYGDFTIALILLVFIVPKPGTTPFARQVEEYLNKFTFGNFSDGSGNSVLALESGNADEMNQMPEELLYTVFTNEPNYLKMQSFSYYNLEKNNWYKVADESGLNTTSLSALQNRNRRMNYADFARAILAVADDMPGWGEKFLPESDRYFFTLLSQSPETAYTMRLRSEGFTASYIPLPSRVTWLTHSDRDLFAFLDGGVFSNVRLSGYLDTEARYYTDLYREGSGFFDTVIGQMNYDEYLQMVSEISDYYYNFMLYDTENYDPSMDEILTLWSAFIGEASEAAASTPGFVFPEATGFYIPPVGIPASTGTGRMAELSREIVTEAGAVSDYEKAKALENYFHTSGYEYVLGYTPVEGMDTAEHFIFENKIGTCSDFASAFCLLARELGMTVRYTEGFVPIYKRDEVTETETVGVYEITTHNAHAYPEVFLPGGWMRFEPTVGNFTNFAGTTTTAAQADNDMEVLAIVIFWIILAILVILFLIFRKRLAEAWFLLRLKFVTPQKAIIMVYARLGASISEKDEDFNALCNTPDETSDYIKTRTTEGAEEITDTVNSYVFGENPPNREDLKLAVKKYKELKKQIKSYHKRYRKNVKHHKNQV